MKNFTKIAVDVMGEGDTLSGIIASIIEILNQTTDIKFLLVGNEALIGKELLKYDYDKSLIKCINAAEVIGADEAPVMAVRQKPDSSVVKGLSLLESSQASALITCAPNDAVLAAASICPGKLGRIENIPIATILPKKNGYLLLVDSGATGNNVKSSSLVTFAVMGSVYMEQLTGTKGQKVSLISDAPVPSKAGAAYREAYELLRNHPGITFRGTVSCEQLFVTDTDVAVCDGFTGKIIRDMCRGLTLTFKDIIEKYSRHRSLFGLKANALKAFDSTGFFKSDVCGISFLPGIKGNIVSLSSMPEKRTIKRAVSFCRAISENEVIVRLSKALHIS